MAIWVPNVRRLCPVGDCLAAIKCMYKNFGVLALGLTDSQFAWRFAGKASKEKRGFCGWSLLPGGYPVPEGKLL